VVYGAFGLESGAVTLNFLIRRVLTALLTLALSSALVFSALLIVPGDPVQLILGLNYEPGQYALLKTQLGLDKAPLERFVSWWASLLRGDMGRSLSLNSPVSELVITRLPVTMPLVILSSLVSLLIAIPAGIFAARRKGTVFDVMTVALTQTGLAIPSFWLGLMLILLFAVTLGWLPANGWTAWSEDPVRAGRSLVLPVLTLALGQAAGLVRMVRGSVLEVMGLDYVRTARSKGLLEGLVMRRHILRNAYINILTLVGIQFGQLLAGGIVVETVFAIPGLGKLGLDAVRSTDFPLVQGVVLVIAGLIVVVNLIVDLLYGTLDPRIRYD
jgi:peptide/nickel transport system permease protein